MVQLCHISGEVNKQLRKVWPGLNTAEAIKLHVLQNPILVLYDDNVLYDNNGGRHAYMY